MSVNRDIAVLHIIILCIELYVALGIAAAALQGLAWTIITREIIGKICCLTIQICSGKYIIYYIIYAHIPLQSIKPYSQRTLVYYIILLLYICVCVGVRVSECLGGCVGGWLEGVCVCVCV